MQYFIYTLVFAVGHLYFVRLKRYQGSFSLETWLKFLFICDSIKSRLL